MILFTAQLKDLAEVTALVNSAYRGESSRLGWTTEADLVGGQRTDVETLRKEISESRKKIILCLREAPDTPIVGSVCLEFFDNSEGVKNCYLGMLTVSPGLQNQGLGRKLLSEAEKLARHEGAKEMHLGVIFLRESLMQFYERCGYRKNGKTEKFPYEDPSAGQPLRSDLYFVMFEKNLKNIV